MAMNMDAILNVKARVDGANKIVELNRGLKTMEGTARGLTGAMRGLTGASAGLSGALGALAPLLSVAGLVGLAKGALDAGDKMNDLSQSTGVSVEALARFKKAAATSGTDIDTVAKGLKKLSINMVAAETGNKKAAAAFAVLGVSTKNANGQFKTADRVMLELANKFKGITDPVKKTALAAEIFGKKFGPDLIPLLNMGGAAIDKLSVKMTTAFAEKADAYNDKLAGLSGKVGALGADLLIALLPALDAVTDAVTAGVGAFNSLPGPIKGLALAGASLAIAWGPISGLISGASALFIAGAAAVGTLRVQIALAAMEGIPALSAAIMAIPGWGWALAGVAAITALTTALYLNNEDFKNWADNVTNIVANDFLGAMADIAKGAQDAFKGAADAGNWFGDRAKEIADSIPKGFADGFGRMVKAAQQKFAQMQAIVMGWWARIPAPVRGLLSKGASALSDALNVVPGVYTARVAIQAMGKGPVAKKSNGNGNDNGNGGGYSPDLSALSGSNGGKSKAASDKTESDRKKLEIDAARIALQAQYVKDERQINDLKRIGNSFQANGNTLKAFEVQKSEAILEAKLAETKLTDETVIKLKESANDKDKANRKQRDTNILGEAAVKMAAEEEKLRSKLLDIDQQLTQERKKQARDQADALRDIGNRNRYKKIGDLKGSEAEQRQREVDGLQQKIDDARAPGGAGEEEAKRLEERLRRLKESFKELDALANNAGYGIAKGIRGYLEGIGSLADSVASVTRNVLQGLEDKLVEFVTTGKLNFREFANDIIKQLIRIAIQQAIIKPLLSGLGFATGGIFGGGGAGIAGGQSIQYAANGMIAANGIKPFAKGDIFDSPTFFKFASGGTLQNGVLGEAGPEAILPLRRGAGGKLGVIAGGSSGTNNITVNVDAKGSSVQGDNSQAKQLAAVVSAAVQAEMIKQQRPGGLLSGARR
jgi:lambda family phage tail tape measure protein